MSEDKAAKQKAFLKSFYDRADYLVNHGIRDLKYFRESEVDGLEKELTQIRDFFTIMPKSKKELKETTEKLEDLTFYCMYLWIDNFLNTDFNVDPAFEPELDKRDAEYKQKFAKALEAKQKKAPGFDGAGGGMGRRKDI